MNANRLLTHYEQIADAPDAIARLRRFILDLAVRGKLVPQDPNDEPVETLLESVAAKKEKLVKAGKIRSRFPLASFKKDESPFRIPATWCWVRFGTIADFSAGRTPSRNEPSFWNSGDHAWVSIADMKDGETLISTKETVSKKAAKQVFGVAPEQAGTMIMSFKLTIGKIGRLGIPAYHNEAIISIRPYAADLDPHLFRFLPMFAQQGKTKGAIKGHTLNRKSISHILLPLPPLAEQHRIVAKVDELMGLCDRLAAARTQREAMRDRMGAASLVRLNDPDPNPVVFRNHAAFAIDNLTTLTTRTDQIKAMRQTILNLAVRGKLVPQDPNDEPASELVKRIAKEKARLVKAGVIGEQKALPSLANAKTSFELPQGWVWTRLGHLSQLVTSGSRDWAKHYSNEGAIFLRMGNLSKDHYHLRLEHIQRVKPPANSEGTRTRLEDGDICISITGDVGMLGLIPEGFSESYINQHTALVRPMPELKGRYLAEMFRSPFAQQQFNEPQRGIKNSFRLTDVTQFAVPLPPLAEQRRIVANVDRLLALCAQLEARLTSSDQARRLVLEALLQEALAPSAEIIRQDSSTITQEIPDKPRGRHKVLTEPTPIGTSPK